MAIYAVQGLYAVRCLFMINALFRSGFNISLFKCPGKILKEGAIKEFVDFQAKEMGLKKEIIVIQGQGKCSCSFGNAWLSSKIIVPVLQDDEKISNVAKFNITHDIAHIKFNNHLITFGAALVTTLFTTFVLGVNRNLFTRYLGGFGVGLITQMVLDRIAKRRADQEAMKHCSTEVNEACLEALQKRKENDCPCFVNRWGLWLFNPSVDERIGYFQDHLQSQKTV